MSCLKMSLGNAIFVLVILMVSYATGITGTRCCYADLAAHSLTKVASMRRYDLAISDTKSGCKGLQTYAFTYTGSSWEKRTITWTIEKYSQWLTESCVDVLMARAFQEWADWIPFEFKRVPNNVRADIRIGFADSLPKLTLGVTSVFSRKMDDHGGDIVFSDTRNWVYKNRPGYADLRHVAVHEIGHALGLDHSEDPRAVMYASHDRYSIQEDFHLHDDDIDGIQKLYGSREGGPPRRPRLPPPTPTPTLTPSRPYSPPENSDHLPTPTPVDPSQVPIPAGADPDKVQLMFGPVMNEKGDFIAYMTVNGRCRPYRVNPHTNESVPYDG